MKSWIVICILLGSSLFGEPFLRIQKQLMEAEEQLQQAEQLSIVRQLHPTAIQPERMTGDWGGWRSWLECKGVTFISSYTTDLVGNPVGGHARGFTYTGSYGLGLDVDFEKALGAKGLEFFTSAVWRTGTSLTLSKIKNQFNVQQVFGSQTVKLNELFFKESLFNGRWILKAGRLDAGNDFFQSNLYYQFVNNAFDGNPVAIFNNMTFSAYPNATWGAYTSFIPYKRVLIKAGVYNANNYISKNRYHGVNFTFRSTNGVIWITEWAYQVNQLAKDRGMPGNYRAGFVYQTGPVSKFTGERVRGDYSYYFLIDQMIYRPSCPVGSQGLTPFIAILVAPKDRNLFPFFTTAGLIWQGPFSKRPRDSASFGVAYGNYSTDLDEAERKAGKEVQTSETVLELNYWFQVNDWFQITPDFQYVIHPRGLDIPNAFCIGAQIGFIL